MRERLTHFTYEADRLSTSDPTRPTVCGDRAHWLDVYILHEYFSAEAVVDFVIRGEFPHPKCPKCTSTITAHINPLDILNAVEL